MRRGSWLPAVLIGVGVVALLVNLGALPAATWREVLALWPLLLVLVGVDILLARRSPALAAVVELAIVALALVFVVVTPRSASPLGAGRVEFPRESARTLELTVAMGGGVLDLRGGASALVEATSTQGDLESGVERSGGHAAVRLESSEQPLIGRAPTDWRVRVASDVDVDLRVAAGAGDFTIDLSDVRATLVRIDSGASSLRLVLPKPSGEVAVRVSSGASSIRIEAPSGVEYRVSTAGALLSVDGRTESAGYGSASDRVTVTVSAGASSVTIR